MIRIALRASIFSLITLIGAGVLVGSLVNLNVPGWIIFVLAYIFLSAMFLLFAYRRPSSRRRGRRRAGNVWYGGYYGDGGNPDGGNGGWFGGGGGGGGDGGAAAVEMVEAEEEAGSNSPVGRCSAFRSTVPT